MVLEDRPPMTSSSYGMLVKRGLPWHVQDLLPVGFPWAAPHSVQVKVEVQQCFLWCERLWSVAVFGLLALGSITLGCAGTLFWKKRVGFEDLPLA